MSVSTVLLKVLYEPTPPTEVKQRQGPGGKMLDYIDARYVMDRLDQLGPENWQDVYVQQGPGIVECRIGILIQNLRMTGDDEWVWKADVGTASDIEPEKGAYSDAFKRAAVKWGIGRDLYDHAPSRPASRPASRPVAVRTERESVVEDDVPPDVWAGTVSRARDIADEGDSDTCREHGVTWSGTKGDRYHKKADGSWCRAADNVPKRRSA